MNKNSILDLNTIYHNSPALSIKQTKQFLLSQIKNNKQDKFPHAILLLGDSGQGKTSLVRQLTEEAEIDLRVPPHWGSICKEDAIIGCKVAHDSHDGDNSRVTNYRPPKWLSDLTLKPKSGKGIVVLEDVLCADYSQHNQLRELIDERRLSGENIHPGWLTVLTSNPPDREHINVKIVDLSIQRRLIICAVKNTYEEAMLYWDETKTMPKSMYELMLQEFEEYYEELSPRQWALIGWTVDNMIKEGVDYKTIIDVVTTNTTPMIGEKFKLIYSSDNRKLTSELMDCIHNQKGLERLEELLRNTADDNMKRYIVEELAEICSRVLSHEESVCVIKAAIDFSGLKDLDFIVSVCNTSELAHNLKEVKEFLPDSMIEDTQELLDEISNEST